MNSIIKFISYDIIHLKYILLIFQQQFFFLNISSNNVSLTSTLFELFFQLLLQFVGAYRLTDVSYHHRSPITSLDFLISEAQIIRKKKFIFFIFNNWQFTKSVSNYRITRPVSECRKIITLFELSVFLSRLCNESKLLSPHSSVESIDSVNYWGMSRVGN